MHGKLSQWTIQDRPTYNTVNLRDLCQSLSNTETVKLKMAGDAKNMGDKK